MDRLRYIVQEQLLEFNDDILKLSTENHLKSTDQSIAEIRGRCLHTILRVLDAKDPESHQLSHYAAALARLIAEKFDIDPSHIKLIELGVMLRDIGKIGIPDVILHKKGKLTVDEMRIMQTHPIIGVNILSPLLGNDPIVIDIVKHHHERFDGTGYPDRIRAYEISIEARIVSVVDAFIAMVSNKSYRNAMPADTALKNLTSSSGVQWDREVVDALLAIPRGIVTGIASKTSHENH